MSEYSFHKERMNKQQQAVVDRLDQLWDAAEAARQQSFPNLTDENLPRSYQQNYLEIKHRIGEIIMKMAMDQSFVPDEQAELEGIRVSVWKFLQRNDLKQD